ncbi:MAG: Ig-like domain-containing protein [Fibrobacterota bacterium]|nr:Ig-like domain-containing protein [Fibrobacterota bacterium]
MAAPPGGPEDTKRPYVTAVFPAPDSTNVSRELKAQIAFSEWVATDAERGKVYLVPPLTRKIKTRLKGNIIEVTSAAELDTNTSYILGVLPTIKDLNGKSIEGAMQLAFSTGPKLDSGRLKGRVSAFQGKPPAGSFAALYPRGAGLRGRFQHLTHRNDSVVAPSAQPDPLKERPAYIAPADSLGRFDFKAMRPGRYGLIGFQDINGDLIPGMGAEALAIGPSVDVAGASAPLQYLALAPYDTVAVRLTEVRWAGERVSEGKSHGTVRLKFNRPPHPTQSLRRESYTLRKLGPKSAPHSGAALPVQDVCLNPSTGEIELSTMPLDLDSQYVASCAGLRDLYGNLVDTARDDASFRVDKSIDTAKPEMTFLGPRKVSGEVPRLPVDKLLPSRGITVFYPRLLGDSTLAWLRSNLVLKVDTLPARWSLARLSHHEFSLQFAVTGPLKGQRLSIALKDSLAKPSVPQTVPVAAFTLADSSKLGSLVFRQDASAYGSRLVICGAGSPWEFSRITPASPEFTVDSLPEGLYSVDYFRDTNGDAIWHPGSLAPWAVQEPYAQWADSVEVKPGAVNRGDGNRPAGTDKAPESAETPGTAGTPATGTPNPGTTGSGAPISAPGAPAKEASSTGRKLSWPPAW